MPQLQQIRNTPPPSAGNDLHTARYRFQFSRLLRGRRQGTIASDPPSSESHVGSISIAHPVIRILQTTALIVPLLCSSVLKAEKEIDSLPRLMKAAAGIHPRIFIDKNGIPALKKRIQSDPSMRDTAALILRQADALKDEAPLTRALTGRRLLSISRECLNRVFTLSMAYTLTGEKRYAQRAEKEMLAAAAFKNWNPSHFLDVAEMTAALGIGYDWLYAALPEKSRDIIRHAIVQKGLKTSIPGGWWTTTSNNWNQVCNGGLAIGALAIMDAEPALAANIIRRSVLNLPHAMDEYAPDGAYPEGPSYWRYGTTYNVMILAALESAFKTDFGLSKSKGFLETSDYFIQSLGPSGLHFNYSDGRPNSYFSPTLRWFAGKRNMPGLLRSDNIMLQDFLKENETSVDNAHYGLALTLLWSVGDLNSHTLPALHWSGRGKNPVSFHRSSSKDKNATYFGIKGGSPSNSHGHMDIGSFVIDALGERWAHDLGMQNYHSLETRGISLWPLTQDSQRWTVFRLNNFSHNTLVVDGKKQIAAGFAPIQDFSDATERPCTLIDMSPAYKGQLAKAHRGMALLPDHSILVQDEIQTTAEETSIRWGMVTSAEVQIKGSSAKLSLNGKSLQFKVLSPKGAELKMVDVATPRAEHDAPNPGMQMIAFTVKVPASTSERLVVHVAVPGGKVPEIQELQKWLP